jgi:hypothetical protein
VLKVVARVGEVEALVDERKVRHDRVGQREGQGGPREERGIDDLDPAELPVGYVLHVADNLRMHGERTATASRGAQFEFVHADQDELAAVRSYEAIAIEGALWSLDIVLVPYIEIFRDLQRIADANPT